MSIVTMSVTLELLTCNNCAMQFAVPNLFIVERRRDHATFYCPSGHHLYYPEESDIARVEREKREAVNRLQAALNEKEHLLLVREKECDAAMRAKRCIESRISKGVCPCCNRTFGDLAKHIDSKHKGYGLPPAKDRKLLEAPQ